MTIFLGGGESAARRLVRWIKALVVGVVWLGAALQGRAQLTQPMVAIHNSELTLAFENMPSTPDTPTGYGTTNKQWWSTDWHYLVMPQSIEEALRSDGTPFTVIGDSNVMAGILVTNGQPKYPVMICFASEAIDDSEIPQFTNYVASGGFLIVSGASFTRNTNGTTRGDFAFANAMGIHMANNSLANYYADQTLTNLVNNRLTSHIPFGGIIWRLCQNSEENNWGYYPDYQFYMYGHDAWQITASDATVLANGDTYPYYTMKPYGKGYFIYAASFNPLFCTGGFGPGTTVYLIFRHAIEWAFQNANLPVPRISPWPYQYDAAFLMRHDLENFPDHITNIEASAQIEASYGAKGDYYFCTGVLKQDMPQGLVGSYDTNAVVQSIRRAITNYGATVSTHNGGLPNDLTGLLGETNYDYWHWGPDEAFIGTNTPGYPDGVAYAKASISNSFVDIESWFAGLDSPSLRIWCSPNFNATRDASYQLQEQLGVKITGEQKIGAFPHFTFSTKNPTQWFHFLQEPVSDWFVNGNIAQSLEPWHEPWAENTNTLHAGIDFYYNNGLLINFYSHTMSTGLGDAGGLTPEYLSYCSNTNLHPRAWSANGTGMYQWWIQRSNAHISVSYSTNGMQSLATISISGSTSPNTAVEYLMPGTNAYCSLQVFANGSLASPNTYRTVGQIVRVLVGTTVTNVVIGYYPYGGLTSFAENFDEVTAPALPNGWATSASGGASPWITEMTVADTGPNAAYTADATTNGLNELDSPVFTLPPGQSQLTFRNYYDLEVDPSFPTNAFDGGVLEIKIGAGSYTDILAAGGTFVSGGYNSTINSTFGNPLAGRQAWSGNSGGFITTTVSLPSLVSTQSIQLRWRCGTDNANGKSGWRIDTVSVGGYACLCCTVITNPPVLPAQTNRTINQFSTMTVTNTATDVNGPGDTLTYALQNPPPGAQINTNGIITWTPGGGQAPSTNIIVTIVTDLYAQSATNSFTVVVNDVNTPPMLPAQSNRSIVGLTSLVVTNTATDTNVPPASLTYGLLVAPTNASISTNGIITWNPVVSQVPSTNVFTTVVTNFNPLALVNQHLTATNSFTVTDLPLHNPPVLPAQSNRTIVAQTTLVVTNTATENDLPPLALTYSLLVAPSGASISTNGIITWTPPGSPSNTTNTITTIVQDNGSPKLSATNSFTVVAVGDLTCQYVAVFTQNFDGVTHPALPTNGWTTVASGVESNWITVTNFHDTLPNSAFAPDVPNIGESDLVSPTIALSAGQNLLIFRNDYNLEYNTGKPTDGYDGGVLEIKIGTNAFADVITAGGSFNSGAYNTTIDGTFFNPLANRPAWSANSGGFITTSVTLPPSASGQNIQLRWRIGCDNGNVASGTPGWWIDSVVISNLVCAATGPVLSAQTNHTINELSTLTVTNAATNGTPPLTYTLLNPAGGASINSSGVITWTPAEGQAPSTNAFTTVVTDSESTPQSATNSFLVVVIDVNDPPTLPTQTNVTIDGMTTLVVTNTASDSNIPPATLTYSFLAAPTNATIDTNGIISWTPVAAQVPSTNLLTTVVTNFDPYATTNQHLAATNSFTVTVNAVHNGPSLGIQVNRTINEFVLLTVVNTATDIDVPVLGLSYQLLNPPANASIDGNGVITWTPAEGQGPSTNVITTRVTDDGIPPLSATNSFVVVVNDVNVPPVLPTQTNQTIVGLATLVVTNTASDSNIPAVTLSYGFVAAPTNAAIDTNGIITWTPVPAQVPSTNVFTTAVTNFNPYAPTNQRLTATNSFTVTVNAIHDGPSLGAQADRTVDEFSLLTVVNTASDSDVPALALTYGLLNPPAGANIDSNGVITWTPAEGQGPGTNTITTVVQDNGTPSLSATNSFVVTVNDVNVPPVLPDQTNQTIIATATLVVTNTANDPNIPATTLSYGFLAAPTNASIDANGVITWTPVVAQVPSTNTFTTVVTNFNPYALVNQRLTATNSFVVTVAAVHNGPSLSALSDRTVNEFAQLVVTNTATDSDIPPFPLNYVLLNPPVSANIDENGIITWTPSQAQAGTTNSIVTVVTDQGVPPLSATNSFLVMVNPPPSPPFIISISITNGVAWVTWTSTSGYTYQLQFKDNISDTNWSPADASMKAGGDSLTGTNVSGGSMQRLYRVMIVPGD
jgi:hypothetical protein